MAFDYDAARADGIPDEEIARHLASQTGFNLDAALKDGVPVSSIVKHLVEKTARQAASTSTLPRRPAAIPAEMKTALGPGAPYNPNPFNPDYKPGPKGKPGPTDTEALVGNALKTTGLQALRAGQVFTGADLWAPSGGAWTKAQLENAAKARQERLEKYGPWSKGLLEAASQGIATVASLPAFGWLGKFLSLPAALGRATGPISSFVAEAWNTAPAWAKATALVRGAEAYGQDGTPEEKLARAGQAFTDELLLGHAFHLAEAGQGPLSRAMAMQGVGLAQTGIEAARAGALPDLPTTLANQGIMAGMSAYGELARSAMEAKAARTRKSPEKRAAESVASSLPVPPPPVRETAEVPAEKLSGFTRLTPQDFAKYGRMGRTAGELGLEPPSDLVAQTKALQAAQEAADVAALRQSPEGAFLLRRALNVTAEPGVRDAARYAKMQPPAGLEPPDPLFQPPSSPPSEGERKATPVPPPPEPPPPPSNILDDEALPVVLRDAVEHVRYRQPLPPQLAHLQDEATRIVQAQNARILEIATLPAQEAAGQKGAERALWEVIHGRLEGNVPQVLGGHAPGENERETAGVRGDAGASGPQPPEGPAGGIAGGAAAGVAQTLQGSAGASAEGAGAGGEGPAPKLRTAPQGPGQADRGEAGPQVASPVHGEPTTLYVRGDKSYPATYALVEASQLKADTEEGQNRNANSIAAKFGNNGEHFVPEEVLAGSPFAQNGPPIVLEDGTVIGGNTRLKGILHSISRNPGKAEAYYALLALRLPEVGIDAARVKEMREPVLVRVVPTPKAAKDLYALVGEINEPTTSPLTMTERAAQDAKVLPDSILDSLEMNEGESFAHAIMRASNSGPRLAMMRALFPELSRAVDTGARITPLMLKRMEAAALAKALRLGKESIALDMMLESPDAGVNILRDALAKKSGLLAKASSYQDSRAVEGDPMGDLGVAIEKYASLKYAGRDPAEFAAQTQQSVFGEEASKEGLTDRQMAILKDLADLARSPRQLAEYLERMAQGVVAAPAKAQGNLFSTEGESKKEPPEEPQKQGEASSAAPIAEESKPLPQFKRSTPELGTPERKALEARKKASDSAYEEMRESLYQLKRKWNPTSRSKAQLALGAKIQKLEDALLDLGRKDEALLKEVFRARLEDLASDRDEWKAIPALQKLGLIPYDEAKARLESVAMREAVRQKIPVNLQRGAVDHAVEQAITYPGLGLDLDRLLNTGISLAYRQVRMAEYSAKIDALEHLSEDEKGTYRTMLANVSAGASDQFEKIYQDAAEADAAQAKAQAERDARRRAMETAPFVTAKIAPGEERNYYTLNEYLDSGPGFKRVKGSPIRLEADPEGLLDLFVHRETKDNWSVTDAMTGYALALGSTREEAIARAEKEVSSRGLDFVRHVIGYQAQQSGLSPRYGGGEPAPKGFQDAVAELQALLKAEREAVAQAQKWPPDSRQAILHKQEAQKAREAYENALKALAAEQGQKAADSARSLAEGSAQELHAGLGGVAGVGRAAYALLKAAQAQKVPVLGEAAPAAEKLLSGAADVQEDLLKAFSPYSLSNKAQVTANIVRFRNAEKARKMEMAKEALRETARILNRLPPSLYSPDETGPLVKQHGFTEAQAAQLAFIQRMEQGRSQPTAELDNAAKALRVLLDSTWREVQRAKGTRAFLQNYFPHIWAKPEDAASAIGRIMGKRPLKGPATFLYHRTIPTTMDGIEAGLRPASTNPVELTLLKVHEMNRFLMGEAILQDLKERGLLRYFPAGRAPDPAAGLVPLNDKVGTVYGPPEIKLAEAFDEKVFDGLTSLALSLGITHQRLASLGHRDRWGEADSSGRLIRTRFAGPESVLAHEIGHAMDAQFGLWKALVEDAVGVGAKGRPTKTASRAKRAALKRELRALADLYWEGQEPPSKYHQEYLHKRTEQIAHIIEAYIHAPEKLREVAPTVTASFEKFLAEHPEAAPLRDIKPSLVLGTRDQPIRVPGIRIMGRWYVPAEAGQVLNNFLSPGLSGNPLFDAWRGIGNTLNQASLGVSGFHLLFTANDAAVSRFSLGLEQAIQGKPLAAAKSFATTPVAPVTNILKGHRLAGAYVSRDIRDPRLAQMVDALVQAGGRVKMDEFYLNNNVQKFFQALREDRYGAAALRAVPAAIETLAKPIMEWIVPRQKLGVFYDLAAHELARLGPGADEDAVRQALAKVWDSVDNRMGQLVYDNLFWNRAAKDLGLASVRSLGWNIGTVRELGGAVVDTARALSGRSEPGSPKFTHRMAYAVALPIVTGLQGAILTYLFTGKGPQSLMDYWLVPTGRKNPDGTDERIVLPSYMKDVMAAGAGFRRGIRPGLEGLATMAGHKLHPLASSVMDMLKNQDFYGVEIAHPGDAIGRQVLDSLLYLAKQAVPFSMRGYEQRRLAGETPAKAAGAFLGINPAPAYLTRTPAQAQMAEYLAEKMPKGARTREQAERAMLRKRLLSDLRSGAPGASDRLREAIRGGKISLAQGIETSKRANEDPMILAFSSLSFPQAQHVMQLASPEEKRRLAKAYVLKWLRLRKADPAGAAAFQADVMAVRDAYLRNRNQATRGATP